jgi:hypothetical protein
MIPHGKHLSMRIFPSTFTTRCIKIVVTSLYVNAYFNRLRKIKHNGKHSRCLCGPNSRENKVRKKNSSVSYSNHPRASRGVHASAKRPTKTRHPKPYAPHRHRPIGVSLSPSRTHQATASGRTRLRAYQASSAWAHLSASSASSVREPWLRARQSKRSIV